MRRRILASELADKESLVDKFISGGLTVSDKKRFREYFKNDLGFRARVNEEKVQHDLSIGRIIYPTRKYLPLALLFIVILLISFIFYHFGIVGGDNATNDAPHIETPRLDDQAIETNTFADLASFRKLEDYELSDNNLNGELPKGLEGIPAIGNANGGLSASWDTNSLDSTPALLNNTDKQAQAPESTTLGARVNTSADLLADYLLEIDPKIVANTPGLAELISLLKRSIEERKIIEDEMYKEISGRSDKMGYGMQHSTRKLPQLLKEKDREINDLRSIINDIISTQSDIETLPQQESPLYAAAYIKPNATDEQNLLIRDRKSSFGISAGEIEASWQRIMKISGIDLENIQNLIDRQENSVKQQLDQSRNLFFPNSNPFQSSNSNFDPLSPNTKDLVLEAYLTARYLRLRSNRYEQYDGKLQALMLELLRSVDQNEGVPHHSSDGIDQLLFEQPVRDDQFLMDNFLYLAARINLAQERNGTARQRLESIQDPANLVFNNRYQLLLKGEK